MSRAALSMWTLVAVVSAPAMSAAFVPSGFRVDLPVRYEVNTASSEEMGRQTTLQVIDASYQNWASPRCSGYSYQFTGETNDSWQAGDRTNTLIWIYNPNQRPRELGGRSTIGVTLSITQGNRGIDGDILFNGIDHSWTTNAVRQGQVDAVSIITHETGHQLGLNHSPFQSATMYAAYLGGDAAATLSEDDVEGVCTLYPSGAEPECRNDDNCPEGERCIGGECSDGPVPGMAMIGDDCNQGDCAPGLFCAQSRDGSSFCTRECGAGCPDGWECTAVRQGNRQFNVCLPGEDDGGGAGAFGDACSDARDCASGFCVSNGQEAFCTQACAGEGDCPEGSGCVGTNGGGGACLPGAGNDDNNGNNGGDGAFGEACEDHGDCASNVCVGRQGGGGFCSDLCDQAADCPADATCEAASNGQGVCVPGQGNSGNNGNNGNGMDPEGGRFGDPCDGAEECESEICVSDGNTAFCTERCDDLEDCPPGAEECVNTNRGGVCLPGDDPRPPPAADSGLPPLDNLPTFDAGAGNGGQNSGGDGAGGDDTPGNGGINGEFVDAGQGGGTPTPVPVAGTPGGGGCACDVNEGDPTPWTALLFALLLGRARRRR